jgi:salicylate hydroxylase
MQLIIAGAGIGGLTAALCLSRAGHEVLVLESTGQFRDIGAGIQCGANALHVMKHLGLLSQLLELGVLPSRVEFRDYETGSQLLQMELGKAYEYEYASPYLHLHRSDLHQVLLDTFNAECPGNLRMNAQLTSFIEKENYVQIELGCGDTLEANLLIGADGISSTVRRQLCGTNPPVFTGNVAWRGVVPVERLPAQWMETVVSNFVGPEKHMVMYYLRQKKLANFVGVVENKNWTNDTWSAKAPWEELSLDFKGWHPMVREIINAADKDSCFRWALYDHQPLNNWSSNCVTLLGDAAHATLPFMASGAALAIEDARVLQRALDQASNLGDGLQLYQRNRMKRTAKIQAMSARAGSLYHFKSRLLRKTAFTALNIFGSQQQSYLPDYDANEVKLV